jgi:hypothetical protein
MSSLLLLGLGLLVTGAIGAALLKLLIARAEEGPLHHHPAEYQDSDRRQRAVTHAVREYWLPTGGRKLPPIAGAGR